MVDDEPTVIQLSPASIVTLPELSRQGGELANAQVRFIGRCAPPCAAHLRGARVACVINGSRSPTRAPHRLKTIDCVQGIAVLEDQGACAIVETSQLSVEQQLSRVGGLYSVMGEVEVEDAHRAAPLVRARLVRAVDGLDTSLWEQALAIRRQYDARAHG